VTGGAAVPFRFAGKREVVNMASTRRSVLVSLAAGGSALLAGAGHTAAQTYPTQPIRLIVPYSAGGPTDALARIVGQKLGERLKQNVVVENKPGASGMIGADVVATAPPDGHTILINASLHVITPSLYEKMSHDPLNDFAPITNLGSVPLILVVNKDVPAKSVAELLALAKANPGKLTFASSGIGASSHLAGEMLKTMTGTNLSHVPYRGSGPALNDVIAGHVSMMIDTSPASLPHVEAGSLRVLGVSTAARIPNLPDVPTIAEAGVPGFEITSWYGVWVPRRTPKDIVTKLNSEFQAMFQDPDLRQRFARLGATPVGGTPEEFDAFCRSELDRWAGVVKASGAKLQ
jgi:tripartite-type tricarboxylate transporter receptor subunit TctC